MTFTDSAVIGGFPFTFVSNGEAIVRLCRGFSRESCPDSITELAKRELCEYFSGKRKAFTVPFSLSNTASATDFRKSVWNALIRIPYGSCVSYGELAKTVGTLRGARAVGGAVGANELLILVPCHRVIAANGSLGGFSAGLDLKKKLLMLEKTSGIL